MERRVFLVGQCVVLSILVFVSSFTYLQERSNATSAVANYKAQQQALVRLQAQKVTKPFLKLPESTITSEAIMDDPRFVYGVFDLQVTGKMTSYNLGILMRKHYYQLIKREEFVTANRPVKIEINAYDKYESNRLYWVANLVKTPSMEDPLVKVNSDKIVEVSARMQEDASLISSIHDKWYNVAKVHYSHANKTAELVVEYGHVPWKQDMQELINSRSGEMIEMIYANYANVDNVAVKVYGNAFDAYGNSHRVSIYNLETDRITASQVNFVNLGYNEAVENVFKPWCHSQLKA